MRVSTHCSLHSHMSMCAEDISHLEGLSTLRSLELYGCVCLIPIEGFIHTWSTKEYTIHWMLTE